MPTLPEHSRDFSGSVEPHGGTLVTRQISGVERAERLREAADLPVLTLTIRGMADLRLLACGGFSPLRGFLGPDDVATVLSAMRLAEGVLWPIPVVLPAEHSVAERVGKRRKAALKFGGAIVGTMDVDDAFEWNKNEFCEAVFGTNDTAHPGVATCQAEPDRLVAGPIDFLGDVSAGLPGPFLTPTESRARFAGRGWRTIVGFQTRNPMHRGHEYLTKCALETVDGLFLHPAVGATKGDDVPADVRMACLKALVERYYEKERVVLAVNPANMLYAGPREALLHAIVRQNFGCTHFIVGRDHAGVGGFYDPDAAHRLLEKRRDEIAIVPMFFDDAFWCQRSGAVATDKTTGSRPDERIAISGSAIRAALMSGTLPPPEMMRPEVAAILRRTYQSNE